MVNLTMTLADQALHELTKAHYYYAKGARTLKVEEECSRRRSNEN